ncbi:hypothetical protein [Microtetraspora sp. NBRC 16547]|uniref:hypothetical protein n=1 Tax=Microtetraspora sp. NBRC 16547 TaxID=3030993 RepID=UPI0024A496CA|nr:hypothetical protein [Microtetraspora sp. NBRC 16547]GLW96815.1 hypothetical protein Misp02_09020 [Microtetraspora sp. NBRC 16547]
MNIGKWISLVAAGAVMSVAGCGQTTGAVASASEGPGNIAIHKEEQTEYSFKLQNSNMTVDDPETYNAMINLADGRRVAMFYRRGTGLMEQRYSPQAGGWTKPRAIFRTELDPCQGISMRTTVGTVAVIADFGTFCYDGEPPMESIAAVSTGNFQTWDIHLMKGIDGWERSSISRDGTSVSFIQEGWRILRWNSGRGFLGVKSLPES